MLELSLNCPACTYLNAGCEHGNSFYLSANLGFEPEGHLTSVGGVIVKFSVEVCLAIQNVSPLHQILDTCMYVDEEQDQESTGSYMINVFRVSVSANPMCR